MIAVAGLGTLGGSAATLLRVALAVAVVASCAWLAGRAVARLGQPRVIGEIAAAIALGPSALGAFVPGLPGLFAPELLGSLDWLAEVGVVLFMFFVGLEFNGGLLRTRSRLALGVVAGSVALPFVLGLAVALPFVDRIGGSSGRPWLCALFVGVALSVTAFPVLAAIIEEADLSSAWLGHLALGCAALTDVVAWSLLTVVSAQAKSTASTGAAVLVLGVAAFAAIVLGPLRLLLRAGLRSLPRRLVPVAVPLVGLGLAAVLAAATGRLGVTVILGAFLAGIALGDEPARGSGALRRIRCANRVVLLPVFFVLVGLHLDFTVAGGPLALAGIGLLLLAAAAGGKIGGAALAARLWGLDGPHAIGLGVLLNTKGLTEIVVLRIGYDLGLISAAGLSVLVAVALVTTAATAPLLGLLGLAGPAGAAADEPIRREREGLQDLSPERRRPRAAALARRAP